MYCALTLALSRRAGEGTQRCIERPRFEGRPLLDRVSMASSGVSVVANEELMG